MCVGGAPIAIVSFSSSISTIEFAFSKFPVVFLKCRIAKATWRNGLFAAGGLDFSPEIKGSSVHRIKTGKSSREAFRRILVLLRPPPLLFPRLPWPLQAPQSPPSPCQNFQASRWAHRRARPRANQIIYANFYSPPAVVTSRKLNI